MARVKNSNGLYSVLNDYSNSKNTFIETTLNDKNSGKLSSIRPGNIVTSSTESSNDHLLDTNRLEQDSTAQESFINNNEQPQKSSYNFLKQKSNEKLLLSPLSPSAFSRSTKIRFRCPSVDLIVSPSTASAYSSEDCAEVSVDSWEDDSPLDDEYNLLFGEKNEFPLSYNIMDETSELHSAELENDVAIKKPMNGHVAHDDGGDGVGSRRTSKEEEHNPTDSAVGSRRTSKSDDNGASGSPAGSRRASKVKETVATDSTTGSRRTSKVDENGTTESAAGSRRTSKVDATGTTDSAAVSRRTSKVDENARKDSVTGSRRPSNQDEHAATESAAGSRRTSKVHENGTSDSAVGSRRTSKADSTKNGEEHAEIHAENETEESGDNVEGYDAIGDETNEHVEDGTEEPTRKLSTISAKSEGELEDSKATTVPDEDNKETDEEEFRRVNVVETTAERVEDEEHHEETENVHGEVDHEQVESDGHEVSVENGIEQENAQEEERADVEDDTVRSERGSEPGEEVEASEQIEDLVTKNPELEKNEEHKGDANEDQPSLVNGNANEIQDASVEVQPVIFRSPRSKPSGSPRKGLKPTSPRHVGGPPLRGRPRGAIRAAAVPVPVSSTVDTRLNQSWNSSVRRTQSQSPGRSTSEDFNKSAKTIDLHSIFGKTDAQLQRKKQREEVSQKKRAEDEEKLLAEKEQRRKDAEAAFQSWLRRKAQERRRARSTGRGSTQSQEREESAEQKHKNRAEAEQAFQAWLERKKEEQKERKRQFMTASKSQQQLPSSREDADEAFRQWKDQKSQQRREERMLIRSQLKELQSIVPIDKYGDSSRSFRRTNYSYHSQNGLPKLNNYRTISPANKKRVARSDSLPSINSPDGGGGSGGTVKVT